MASRVRLLGSHPQKRAQMNKLILSIAQANQIIPVVVGGTQDVFVPNVVTAAVGDVVQFQFANGNHTVTQSAQDAACQPLQATVANAVHSGHIPFQDAQTTVGTFSMPVLDTSPMFLYCATGPHCQEGQVLIINPANTQQIVDYAKLAASSGQSGDGTTVQGGAVAQIPLELAAFTPAAPQAQGPPPAAAPAQSSAAAPAPGAVLTVTLPPAAAPAATNAAGAGITTVIVTVPAAL
ncbi:hypothetical protein BJ170DRAFT_420040 [Xylariales sp. AK1849]|nr:hypothetical protein BJ170DRAFT_420040 [Xylariales sp. AK1849]